MRDNSKTRSLRSDNNGACGDSTEIGQAADLTEGSKATLEYV